MSQPTLVEPPYARSRRTESALLPSDIGQFLEDTRDSLVGAPVAVTAVSVSMHLSHEHPIAPLLLRVEEMADLAGLGHRIRLKNDRCEIHLTRPEPG